MYCSKCGSYVDSNNRYCTRCGSPVGMSGSYGVRPANERPINASPINARPIAKRPAVAYAGAVQGGQTSIYERGYQIIGSPIPVRSSSSPIRRTPSVGRTDVELGGFLQFLVVMFKIVSPLLLLASLAFYTSNIVRTINTIEDLKALYSRFGISYNYYDRSVMYLLILLGLVAVICIIGAIVISAFGRKIEKRNSGFLRMFQSLYIMAAVIVIAVPFMIVLLNSYIYGIDPVFNLESIAYVEVKNLLILASGFTVWNLYFTKSKKVYEYMGSDEYLRKSIFNKNTCAPV